MFKMLFSFYSHRNPSPMAKKTIHCLSSQWQKDLQAFQLKNNDCN